MTFDDPNQVFDTDNLRYLGHPHVADPADPQNGYSVMWSDTAGDLKIKINVAGIVKTATIVDYSALP